MSDIVRILKDIAEDKGCIYHYGTKAAINVIDGTNTESDVFFLHEFTNRTTEMNSTNTRIQATVYDGKVLLVMQSSMDKDYFNETGNESGSKYTTNIEPLLTLFNEIGSSLLCAGYDVYNWSNIDITDALDANMNGLLISYKIRVFNSVVQQVTPVDPCDGITNWIDFTTEPGENNLTKFILLGGSNKGKTEFQIVGFATMMMNEGIHVSQMTPGLGNWTVRWRRYCGENPVTDWIEKEYIVINSGVSVISLKQREPLNENNVQFPAKLGLTVTSANTVDTVTDSGIVANDVNEYVSIWNDINASIGVISDPVFLIFQTISFWQFKITPNDYVARPAAAWCYPVE